MGGKEGKGGPMGVILIPGLLGCKNIGSDEDTGEVCQ